MDMPTALRKRLIDDAGVKALAGTRVTWIERPQSGKLEAITLQLIDDNRPQTLKGFAVMADALVQVDGWSASYAGARALKEAIIAALVPAATVGGIRFRRATLRARDGSEDGGDGKLIHRASLDFTLSYSG